MTRLRVDGFDNLHSAAPFAYGGGLLRFVVIVVVLTHINILAPTPITIQRPIPISGVVLNFFLQCPRYHVDLFGNMYELTGHKIYLSAQKT